MYPPTLLAIRATPMNQIPGPNLRTGGSGGSTTMSVFGEIRPSSVVVTSLLNAPGCPGRRHGGSVLNGGNKGGAPLGANVAGRCSRDSPSDLPFKKPPLSGSRAAAHMLPPHATLRYPTLRDPTLCYARSQTAGCRSRCSFFWARLGPSLDRETKRRRAVATTTTRQNEII